MDFPGDNKPSPEEMVSASVWRRQSRKSTPAVPLPTTLAFKLLCLKKNPRNLKVFVVTELPGVISVLPDAYIDPVNKEYGAKILTEISDMMADYVEVTICTLS
nr:multiple organellar RNA editing factor 1, mitochondrial-like isoform X2 [Arachis hypogaea]